ncbi:MAG: hypothetical protein LJE84_12525 [Gammaproteobacteria bacterium]|jgi:predicted flap endonuclease-1-like 5' DNA nuclease|nr:hypothetical protein [Gammaproteobacteria bacterium]
MTYLIGEIVFCLVIAAVIGLGIGWLLAGFSVAAREREWRAQVEQLNQENHALRSAGGRPEPSRNPAPGAHAKADDLRKIEGVGPKIAALLNDAGILTYSQLARASQRKLQAVLEAAGRRFRMHDPATWGEQARLAAAGDWKALEILQKKLKGGRRKPGG